ncbi:MAG: FAD-binding oxidoreductase [Planctomycetes bacterium]|nr:FAD-binding oxidoreductase [Planctomycetota bacterium]
MKGKVLIVGGGAMGTCIAMQVASRCDPLKEPVILIEKGRLGAGSSGRAGAIVHQSYSDREVAGMARDAVRLYHDIQSTTGRSLGFRRTGVLGVVDGSDKEALAQMDADLEMQTSIGIKVRRVEAPEIRHLCPGIEVSDDAVGRFEAEGGYVNPSKAIATFGVLARGRGATTRLGVQDLDIQIENGKVRGVQTADGFFETPNVVLATGSWTARILKKIGYDLPLSVVRNEECMFEMPTSNLPEDLENEYDQPADDIETRFHQDPLELKPVPHPALLDLSTGFHAHCEPHVNQTRVARMGTGEYDAVANLQSLSKQASPEFLDWARVSLGQRMPVYKDMELKGSLAHYTAVTSDHRPIVGPVQGVEGLYIVVGFSGSDFHLAPSIGEGMAQMLLGEPVSAFTPEFFSASRFA